MKIPMMQSITAMNTKPEFKEVYSVNCLKIKDKAKKIRERCLELIKAGERNLNVLANTLSVHRKTLIDYLKELCNNGFIEFITKGGAKIVNVL